MRKLLIMVGCIVLLMAGCVEEKTAEISIQEPEVSPSAALAQENDIQQPDVQEKADIVLPDTEYNENTTKAETKEILQELEGLLEDLKQGDFTDIDLTE